MEPAAGKTDVEPSPEVRNITSGEFRKRTLAEMIEESSRMTFADNNFFLTSSPGQTALEDDVDSYATRYPTRKKSLGAANERKLAQRIIKLERIGYGLTIWQLQRVAFRFAKEVCATSVFTSKSQVASTFWVKQFLNRHPGLPINRYPKGGRYVRSRWNYSFAAYERLLDRCGLRDNPRGIYVLLQFSVAHVKCGGMAPSTLVHEVSVADTCVSVRIMTCCNAAGEFSPACVIFKCKPDTLNQPRQVPPGMYVILSETGRMTSNTFGAWLDHFNANRPPGKCVLLLNGAADYIDNGRVLEFAETNDIHMLCMMANIMCPVQKCIRASFTSSFNKLHREFDREHPEQRVTKYEFGSMFTEAWKHLMSCENLINSYKVSGIHPLCKLLYPGEIIETEGTPKEIQTSDRPDPGRKSPDVHLNVTLESVSNSNLLPESFQGITVTLPESDSSGAMHYSNVVGEICPTELGEIVMPLEPSPPGTEPRCTARSRQSSVEVDVSSDGSSKSEADGGRHDLSPSRRVSSCGYHQTYPEDADSPSGLRLFPPRSKTGFDSQEKITSNNKDGPDENILPVVRSSETDGSRGNSPSGCGKRPKSANGVPEATKSPTTESETDETERSSSGHSVDCTKHDMCWLNSSGVVPKNGNVASGCLHPRTNSESHPVMFGTTTLRRNDTKNHPPVLSQINGTGSNSEVTTIPINVRTTTGKNITASSKANRARRNAIGSHLKLTRTWTNPTRKDQLIKNSNKLPVLSLADGNDCSPSTNSISKRTKIEQYIACSSSKEATSELSEHEQYIAYKEIAAPANAPLPISETDQAHLIQQSFKMYCSSNKASLQPQLPELYIMIGSPTSTSRLYRIARRQTPLCNQNIPQSVNVPLAITEGDKKKCLPQRSSASFEHQALGKDIPTHGYNPEAADRQTSSPEICEVLCIQPSPSRVSRRKALETVRKEDIRPSPSEARVTQCNPPPGALDIKGNYVSPHSSMKQCDWAVNAKRPVSEPCLPPTTDAQSSPSKIEQVRLPGTDSKKSPFETFQVISQIQSRSDIPPPNTPGIHMTRWGSRLKNSATWRRARNMHLSDNGKSTQGSNSAPSYSEAGVGRCDKPTSTTCREPSQLRIPQTIEKQSSLPKTEAVQYFLRVSQTDFEKLSLGTFQVNSEVQSRSDNPQPKTPGVYTVRWVSPSKRRRASNSNPMYTRENSEGNSIASLYTKGEVVNFYTPASVRDSNSTERWVHPPRNENSLQGSSLDGNDRTQKAPMPSHSGPETNHSGWSVFNYFGNPQSSLSRTVEHFSSSSERNSRGEARPSHFSSNVHLPQASSQMPPLESVLTQRGLPPKAHTWWSSRVMYPPNSNTTPESDTAEDLRLTKSPTRPPGNHTRSPCRPTRQLQALHLRPGPQSSRPTSSDTLIQSTTSVTTQLTEDLRLNISDASLHPQFTRPAPRLQSLNHPQDELLLAELERYHDAYRMLQARLNDENRARDTHAEPSSTTDDDPSIPAEMHSGHPSPDTSTLRGPANARDILPQRGDRRDNIPPGFGRPDREICETFTGAKAGPTDVIQAHLSERDKYRSDALASFLGLNVTHPQLGMYPPLAYPGLYVVYPSVDGTPSEVIPDNSDVPPTLSPPHLENILNSSNKQAELPHTCNSALKNAGLQTQFPSNGIYNFNKNPAMLSKELQSSKLVEDQQMKLDTLPPLLSEPTRGQYYGILNVPPHIEYEPFRPHLEVSEPYSAYLASAFYPPGFRVIPGPNDIPFGYHPGNNF